MAEHRGYPSDLTQERWALIEPVITAWKAAHPSVSGHQGRYAMREIVNAIFYQGRTGCQWEYLPHDLPPARRGQVLDLPSSCGTLDGSDQVFRRRDNDSTRRWGDSGENRESTSFLPASVCHRPAGTTQLSWQAFASSRSGPRACGVAPGSD